MHAGYFLRNIRVAGHVLPPGGRSNYQRTVFFLHGKLQALQNIYHFLFGNLHADAGIDGLRGNRDYRRLVRHGIGVRNAADRFAGPHLFQQMGCPVQCAMAVGDIHAPLKTHGRFTAQTQRFGCTADRRAVEGRRFQNDRCGLVRYFRDQTAHNAAQAHGLFRIRNGDHVRCQWPVLVVQSLQMFAFLALAHDQRMAC